MLDYTHNLLLLLQYTAQIMMFAMTITKTTLTMTNTIYLGSKPPTEESSAKTEERNVQLENITNIIIEVLLIKFA